ncbi:MAG TPA: rhomboid family intramembrane serine protease [Chitinophagaceae bacterium]|nr:rhomboid family intramembrane serine protease [Chitinophagaceae bacterium]
MESGIVTYILIAITGLVSFLSFSNVALLNKCIFYPYLMKDKSQWYRFISHGFIHGDMTHLLFNMLTLYFFGKNVEVIFFYLFGNIYIYPLFYLSALVFSSLPSYSKNKNNPHYSALGASGAVSAILFTTILFDPWQTILLKFIIPIPAILFAIGYVYYSHTMSKRGTDNIGHDAHLYGALFGIIFPVVFKPGLISIFIEQLSHPRFLN